MAIVLENLPEAVLGAIRKKSALSNRSVEEEIAEVLAAWAGDASVRHETIQSLPNTNASNGSNHPPSGMRVAAPLHAGGLTPSSIVETDEGPATCPVALLGPSRVVAALPGGERMPDPPWLVDAGWR